MRPRTGRSIPFRWFDARAEEDARHGTVISTGPAIDRTIRSPAQGARSSGCRREALLRMKRLDLAALRRALPAGRGA